jgi:hypothetical protein
MSLQISGKITKVLPLESGQTKSGTEWQKQSFVVTSDAQYNNTYCFEVFGEEKVQNFNKYNKVNDNVTVEFNVNCNEYQGKYYTTLSAWKISKVETQSEPIFSENENLGTEDPNNPLPF